MEMKNEQRQEAIKRLQILEEKGLHHSMLHSFKQDGKLHFSERMIIPSFGVNGILFQIDEEPVFAEAIRKFEEKHQAVVYHATHEKTEFGDLLDLFYVSSEQEEWEMDRADLADNYCFGYCLNLTYSECSEFGTFSFKGAGGGLIRTM